MQGIWQVGYATSPDAQLAMLVRESAGQRREAGPRPPPETSWQPRRNTMYRIENDYQGSEALDVYNDATLKAKPGDCGTVPLHRRHPAPLGRW